MTQKRKNKINAHLADENGYTLVELLTVFGIAGFLFVMAISVWLFGQSYFTQWNRNVQIVNKLHVIAQGLAEEIYRAKEIHDIEDDRLELLSGNDSLYVYRVDNGALLRNDRPILKGNVSLVSLVFKKIEKRKEDDFRMDLSDKPRFALGINLTVAAGGDTLSTSKMVFPRKPVTWDQIK